MNDFDKLFWGFSFSIAGIVIGWILNQLGQWSRVRKDDKREVRLVLFNLLETYFLFLRSDTSKYFDYYKTSLLSKVPLELKPVFEAQFEQTIESDLVPNFINPDLVKKSKEIRIEYEKSILSLAKIDPILAYYLNGKTDIIERFDEIEKWLTEISPENEEDQANFCTGIDIGMNMIKPNAINETIRDLRKDILHVAFKINLVVRFKAKKAVNYLNNDSDKVMKEQIDELVRQAIENINNQS